jgi:DNA-binding transcriptional regulator YiaG
VLRPGPDLAKIKTISAAESLARRGLSMLRAKRAIEAMIEQGEVFIRVPLVEDVKIFVRELAKAGIKTSTVGNAPVDVREIRRRLGLTQEQFALRFGLDLRTVQNWEQDRPPTDRASLAYLRVIANRPDEAAKAQEESV